MVKIFNGEPAVILIVEDNDADVYLVEEALFGGEINSDVHRVRDGLEALKFLRNEAPYENAPRPDLVLLDLNMPKMDGRQVLQEIDKDESLKAITVVVLTTSHAEKDIATGYSLKANCYITKPVDFEQLRQVVRSIEHFWFSVVRLPDYSM